MFNLSTGLREVTDQTKTELASDPESPEPLLHCDHYLDHYNDDDDDDNCNDDDDRLMQRRLRCGSLPGS